MRDTETDYGDPMERYLQRLEHALATLPARERREIVLETRSHILDRLATDQESRVADVLAQLGEPDGYAGRFLASSETEPRPHPVTLVVRLAARGAAAFFALNAIVAAYAVSLLLFVMAGLKALYPGRLGLWIDEEGGKATFMLTSGTDVPAGEEVLGWWLVPLAPHRARDLCGDDRAGAPCLGVVGAAARDPAAAWSSRLESKPPRRRIVGKGGQRGTHEGGAE